MGVEIVSDSIFDKLIGAGLDTYRWKKTEPTQRCLVGGVSCSERFQLAYNNQRSQGENPARALGEAIRETTRACAAINNVTQLQSLEYITLYTSGHLLGLSFSEANGGCGGGNDTMTPESSGRRGKGDNFKDEWTKAVSKAYGKNYPQNIDDLKAMGLSEDEAHKLATELAHRQVTKDISKFLPTKDHNVRNP